MYIFNAWRLLDIREVLVYSSLEIAYIQVFESFLAIRLLFDKMILVF